MPPTRQAGPLDRTFSTAIAMEKTETPPTSTTAGTACTGAAMGAMRNPHDIAVCKTGQAAAEWAQAHNVDGYVTVDIGDGSKTFNKVPNGHSDLQGDKDGEADVILWAKGRVYIWEVKPNETSGRFRTALRSLARNSPGPGSGVQYGPRRITGECGTTASTTTMMTSPHRGPVRARPTFRGRHALRRPSRHPLRPEPTAQARPAVTTPAKLVRPFLERVPIVLTLSGRWCPWCSCSWRGRSFQGRWGRSGKTVVRNGGQSNVGFRRCRQERHQGKGQAGTVGTRIDTCSLRISQP